MEDFEKRQQEYLDKKKERYAKDAKVNRAKENLDTVIGNLSESNDKYYPTAAILDILQHIRKELD